MGKLIYSMIMSLDGYVNDEQGNFEWAMPSEEVHALANDLQRPVGTSLYGRRMYEVMVAWETMPTEGEPEVIRDFAALWRNSDKVVYSATLADVSSRRTRLERTFDPAAVRALKATTDRDISIGGPTLAAAAFEADLVDDCQLIILPVLVGGGTRALSAHHLRRLQLLDQRRFSDGTTYLSYRL